MLAVGPGATAAYVTDTDRSPSRSNSRLNTRRQDLANAGTRQTTTDARASIDPSSIMRSMNAF